MQHILVVDEGPSVIELARFGLERTGMFRVSQAQHGDEAVEIIEHDPPTLALIELVLPGLSGLEVAIRATRRLVPTTLMTDITGPDARFNALGVPCLRKPISLTLLLHWTEQLRAQSTDAVRRSHHLLLGIKRQRHELCLQIERARRLAAEARRLTGRSPEPEVIRAAHAMIDAHGPSAAAVAEHRLQNAVYSSAGDTPVRWHEIIVAIRDIEARPHGSAPVHQPHPSGRPKP